MKPVTAIVAPEGPTGIALAERARASGRRPVAVVVAQPEQEGTLRRLLATDECERRGLVDGTVWTDSVASAADGLRAFGPPVAVVPGSEFGVEAADALAGRFGLRGNPAATSGCRRHKFAMKRAFAAAGVAHARGGFFADAASALAFAGSRLAYPVYAKPPEGAGTQNVFVCRTPAALADACGRIIGRADGYGRPAAGVVVEEEIAGDEWAVNLFGDGERVFVTSLWRYEKIANGFAENMYFNEILEDPRSPVGRELAAFGERVYRAVGQRIGPAHAEVRLSPSGPVALEIGARLMGGANETFTDLGMRADVIGATLEIFERGTCGLDPAPRMRERLAGATLPYVASGRIRAIRGLDEIAALGTFLKAEIPVKPGDAIAPSRNLDECGCFVWLCDRGCGSLDADLKTVHERFRIEVE